MSASNTVIGWIQYEDSTASTIVTTLNVVFDEMMTYYWVIAFLCLGFAIAIRIISTFKGDGKEELLLGDIALQAFIVVVGLLIWKSYFLTVTNMFNLIADKIFDIPHLSAFFDNKWESIKELDTISWLNIDFKIVIGSIMGILSLVASLGLFVVRKVMLGIIFIFGGLMIAISPLPLYGVAHIKKLMINHIQISGWVVVHSTLIVILDSFTSASGIGTIEYLVMSTMFLTVSVTVPTLSSFIFGGDNFMAIPIASNVVQAKVADTALKHGSKLIGLMNKFQK